MFFVIFFFICFALFAYFKVFKVSSNTTEEGLTQAIIVVKLFPPKELFSSLVNFEFL